MTTVDRIFPSPRHDVTEDQLIQWYSDSRTRPSVAFNFVSSVDGSATMDGRSGGLSDPTDQRILRLLRRIADVLVVGAGTIRAEGYSGELLSPEDSGWRAANGKAERLAIAVVSGSLRLDPSSDFFATAPTTPIIFTSARSPAAKRAELGQVAEVLVVGEETVDPRRVVSELTARGYDRIHSEGGPKLFGSFQEAGAVDELSLTLSPNLVGGLGSRITAWTLERQLPLQLAHVLHDDGALFLRYRVRH